MDDIKFVNLLEKHLLIVQYARGSAGNLVQRIIGADEQYYWDSVINNAVDNNDNPIHWPDEGFRIQTSKLTIEEQLSACHAGYCNIFDSSNNREFYKNTQLANKAIKNKQKLIVKTDFDIRSFNSSVPIVRLIGSPKRKIICAKSLTEVEEDNTLNIDINNLIYEDFDYEYSKLCNYLNLKPNKDVKKFINMWISKQ